MFMCQRNSTLSEFVTKVVSCKLADDDSYLKNLCRNNEPGITKDVFEVILEDTILFPEGGGQPDDYGLINDYEVIRVIRKGTQALHFVKAEYPRLNANAAATPEENVNSIFKAGETVSIKLAWARRFDHMQQHSAQHLITAIAGKHFGFETTSWWLGTNDSTSFIELDTKDITDTQMKVLEEDVNQKIRDALAVTVDVVELDDPKLNTARGRNLPADVKGQIRIVSISGVENNVCCGTHVSSLGQLQMIKILFVEKKKGKCLLHFLAGNRVLNKLGEMFQREQNLTKTLNSPAAELTAVAKKLNLALKIMKKNCDVVCTDLVKLEAKNFLNSRPGPEIFWHYHRDNVDLDFGTTLLREIGVTKDVIILITLKTDGNTGYLLLRLAESIIDTDNLVKLGDQLCLQLKGKGTLRGNLFQAKVSSLNGITKAVETLKDTLCSIITAHSVTS